MPFVDIPISITLCVSFLRNLLIQQMMLFFRTFQHGASEKGRANVILFVTDGG